MSAYGLVVIRIVIVLLSWGAFPVAAAAAAADGSDGVNHLRRTRHLNDGGAYYHTLTSATLGAPNPDAAIGNILKGLVESPVYTNPPYKSQVPLSVEFYYLDFDRVMKGNVNVVGESAALDWSYLEKTLTGSASRNMHAVWRVVLDFPYHWSGQNLRIPQYLLDAGADIRIASDGTKVPNYGDPKIAEAIEQFIKLSGKRYNGDKRLGFVQLGLLGRWGEWHGPYIPDALRESVIHWYATSYSKTELQIRYPSALAYSLGMGRHDDSFAFETLDGAANGGVVQSYYYWPDLVKNGQADYWKNGSMGGETRGELQNVIFEPTYPKRTKNHQDFMECVNVTHTTWMFHHNAFRNGGYTGIELTNALLAHARMGYNFHVPTVSVKNSQLVAGQVDIDVTVTQIGVAPFYYDLRLAIQCTSMTKKTLDGVETIIDPGTSKVFSFTGIPATTECLNAVSLSLESSYGYAGRPIKFAQGNGALAFSLPLPGSVAPPPPGPVLPPTPISVPMAAPVASAPVGAPRAPAPTIAPPTPVRAPVPQAPVPVSAPAPLPVPVSGPVPVPVTAPTAPAQLPTGTREVPVPRAPLPSPTAPLPVVPVTIPVPPVLVIPPSSPMVASPVLPTISTPSSAPVPVPVNVVPPVSPVSPGQPIPPSPSTPAPMNVLLPPLSVPSSPAQLPTLLGPTIPLVPSTQSGSVPTTAASPAQLPTLPGPTIPLIPSTPSGSVPTTTAAPGPEEAAPAAVVNVTTTSPVYTPAATPQVKPSLPPVTSPTAKPVAAPQTAPLMKMVAAAIRRFFKRFLSG